jgi:hypothetical protein
MSAADAKARILLLDLCQLRLKKRVLVGPRRVPDGGTSDGQQATRFALGQTVLLGVCRIFPLLLGEIGGLPYFLRLYWGLEDFLDDVDLQVSLGQQAFQASVFFFEFTDTGGFVGVRPAEAAAPAIERVFSNVVLAADFGDRFLAFFGLLQDSDDLLIGELTFLHSSILPFGAILTSQMVQFLGDRSHHQQSIQALQQQILRKRARLLGKV